MIRSCSKLFTFVDRTQIGPETHLFDENSERVNFEIIAVLIRERCKRHASDYVAFFLK
jgi:hypothetical protein